MPRPPRRALVFLIDGFDPDYLRATRLPHLARLARAGSSTLDGRGALPSLTNVNHVSLLTGTYPERHGLSANFYCDRVTGREVFMDEVAFVREPLLFERAGALGWTTALVTAKEKLTRLLRRGVDLSLHTASVPPELGQALGPPPDIFSMECNLWVLQAAREVAARYAPGLLYVATTDYPEHKLPPDSPEMQQHLLLTDELIGRILDLYDPDRDLVVLTADHGMNAKTRSVSPVRLLAEAGISARGVPLIRDGLYAHHRDLGGAVYLFVGDQPTAQKAAGLLSDAPGVEVVLPRAEAGRYHLPLDRVGDLVCFGRREWALGVWADGAATRAEAGLRSHGSPHEQTIPLIMAGPGVRARAEIEDGEVVDVAPTLCRLLGIEGGAFQGRVLEEALV